MSANAPLACLVCFGVLACDSPTTPDLIPVDAGAVDSAADAELDAGPPKPPPGPHAEPTAAAIEYFSDISEGLTNAALVAALHTKLRADHQSVGYSQLIDAYQTTDTNRDGCTGIFDFYSSKCWQAADACGNYSGEGDCFNREHSWPKSWWGGQTGPDQHQDLVSVIPADGFVNNVRGRLALGEIVSANYTSSNGSRRGQCETEGSPSGALCFEPPDDLKGDFARIYFYVAVRYEGEFSCCSEDAVDGADIRAWQETMLRRWHADDPVDIAERDRNERIFGLQRNRNPFVDFPVYLDRISDL